MSHRLPISHEVDAPPSFRPSTYFTRLVPIAGEPGKLRSVPARRRDCSHCGEELRPTSFDGVPYARCPNGCEDTWHEALALHYGSASDDNDETHFTAHSSAISYSYTNDGNSW